VSFATVPVSFATVPVSFATNSLCCHKPDINSNSNIPEMLLEVTFKSMGLHHLKTLSQNWVAVMSNNIWAALPTIQQLNYAFFYFAIA
jgi:hypothetical protein